VTGGQLGQNYHSDIDFINGEREHVVRGVTVWEEKGVKVVNPLVQICNKEQAESEAESVGYEWRIGR
jgi:hypothetical protein